MHILWLKTELLHPVDKGGKIRTYQMLKSLKRNHKITYLTLDDGTADFEGSEKAMEYCHELIRVPHVNRAKFSAGFYLELALNSFSPLPYFMKKYKSAEMQKEIGERLSKGNFDVVVCDFLMPSVNMPPVTKCASLLFQHNVEALIWRRHYEVQTNPVKKVYLYFEWLKSRRYEQAACRRFDQVVAVSVEDGEMMQQEYGLTYVPDVPTGVDVDFFKPSGGPVDPKSLVFTGSMDWLPNADAIQYFTSAILPMIKQTIPEIKLTIVGRNPSPSLIELSKREPSLIVTGRVEDVRPYIESSAAYIVPLRIGGGTRIKIFEALAMEKPLISTRVGAEGLPITAGEDFLLADTPEEFANAVIRVLEDHASARSMAQHAAEKVRKSFGWDQAADRFAEICQDSAEQHERQGAPIEARQLMRNRI